jgi:predicted RNA-binding Zn-ribbon protein involved in translation (DUF1610 family)
MARDQRQIELAGRFMADPNVCPKCGSDDINQNGACEGGKNLALPVKCDACRLTWVEHHKLQSVSDFEEN